jgi:membrane fusion protein
MSDELFRAQVRAHAESAWLGRILLIRPPSFAFLTGCALALACALGAFFAAGQYTRKARLEGIVAPELGVVRIVAQQSGIVKRVRVAEGEAVEAGAPILLLGDGRESASREAIGSAVAERLEEREHALERERAATAAAAGTEREALAQRARSLAHELRLLDVEIATQESRLALATRGVDRARRLEAIGFLSPAAADRERDGDMEQRSRLQSLERTRLGLARDLASAQLDLRGAASRAAAQLATLDRQRAAFEQERLENGLQYRAAIVAPTAGTVATVLVEPGQMVGPGTPLATLIPRGSRLEVHLFAPSAAIGFVRPGQEVRIRYLAYPHQKFGSYGARVLAVSRNALPASELGFVPPDGSREPLYRIKAALESQQVLAYGRPEPLKAGMQVEADVLLDRRRLIEWIFEPLLALAGRT